MDALRGLAKDVLAITMPNRALTSCFAFIAGMALGGHLDLWVALMGTLMIISTYCSAAVYNNIRDIESDKLNDPDRPLARGSLSVRFAWGAMALLMALGFAFAFLASPVLVIVDLIYIAIGIIYSRFTKSIWLLSYPTLVTSHMVVPVVSGYLLFHAIDQKIALIATFIYLTESLAFSLKDYKDIEGDRKEGMRTLPIAFERNRAIRITALGLVLPLALVWIPWEVLGLSLTFLAMYLVAGLMRMRYAKDILAKNFGAGAAGAILKDFRLILLLEMSAWWFS